VEARALVGREAELTSARAALSGMLDGRGALLLFSGEAGIGKTALADAIAEEAARAGAKVAWGRCWESGEAPAYWPWTQVFRALGRPDPFAGAAEAGGGEARDVRFRIFDRAAEGLRASAQEGPVLVVLDDLHAADVPSLLFLQLVARNLRAGGRLGVVGTYRDAEARVAGPVGALLAKVAREGTLIAPARLASGDVARWVRAEHPEASEVAVARVHQVSEGNPLFVCELLRVRAALDTADLPDGLRAVLDEHVARASPEAREILAVASVLGRDWSDPDLAALAHQDDDAVAARLAEAREAGLVARSAPGRHAFSHVLLRDRIHESLAPSRRAELHRAAGRRLEARGDLASAAHHFLEARARDEAPRVALAAARGALARLAFEEAERLASRALPLVDEGTELSCELEMLLAESLIRMGEGARGKEAAVRAAETARRLEAPALRARAALAYGEELTAPIAEGRMIELLEGALAALPASEERLRARVMARLASALLPPENREIAMRSRALVSESLSQARTLDDDTRLFVLRFAGAAAGYNVTTEERLELARETIALAKKLQRPVVLVDRGAWYAAHLREQGRHAEAAEALDAYLALVREFTQPHYRWRPPFVLATHAALDGDFERADRLSREARAVSEEVESLEASTTWSAQRVSHALMRDDPESFAPDLGHFLARFDVLARFVWWARGFKAIALAFVGRSAEAREQLRGARYEDHNFPGLLMLGQAAFFLRDAEMAAKILDPLLALRDKGEFFWTAHGIACFGPSSRICGELAALLGRTELARTLLEEGVRVSERMASPPFVALCRARLAALGAQASASASPLATARKPPAPPSPRIEVHVTREGETWRIRSSAGADVVLEDRKGLHYLAELVRAPGREMHVTQLADLLEPAGDAGVVLDVKAKDAYRRRLEDLRDTLEEARRFGDETRASRAEAEIDALVEQLAGAVGLGGRDRKMGSHVERARINVQRRLKDVLQRVEKQDAALGRYLAAAIKTGIWCSFCPP
jgi:hypothetical protein